MPSKGQVKRAGQARLKLMEQLGEEPGTAGNKGVKPEKPAPGQKIKPQTKK